MKIQLTSHDVTGPGTGEVTSGPFKNWFSTNSPLSRNIANGAGSLIRNTRINKVMKECYLSVRAWLSFTQNFLCIAESANS